MWVDWIGCVYGVVVKVGDDEFLTITNKTEKKVSK